VGPVTPLWALEVTTTERSEIADLGSWGMPARWSPDGSHVAVQIRDRLLCIIGVVTHDLTCLPELGRVYEFDWSPDGTRLVYEEGLPGALTLLDPGTGQQSTLVRWDDPRVLAALADAGLASVTGVQFQGPLWSPSGRYVAALAMVGTDEGHAGNVVLIFDTRGNIVARGVPFGEFSDARGWSPSGDLFAYASGEPPYRIVDLHVLDVSTGEDRVVASTDNVGRGTIRSLAWSPSGRWLAVVSIVGSGGYYGSQIRVLDLTGGEPPRIFESASILDLVGWGP
jgi:dipeptidyl aminopeptidase/acylaminoacyl peptidase